MALHIIIDGYNLIRQSGELKALDRRNIQLGREALLDKLAAYRKQKNYRITVVFDGSAPMGPYPRRDTYKGITIIYSSGNATADDVIKDLSAKENDILVVSSDNSVARVSELNGAHSMGSPEFEMHMEMVLAFGDETAVTDEDKESWGGTTRKKGPGRRAPKAQRKKKAFWEKL